jgi:Ca2+-binding RTX toxin-like protein
VNANLSLSLTSASSLENLYGGFGNDTLTGNALANWLLGGAGNDSLNGGNGNDTYACNTNTALGSDTITEIGGIDTLTFAGSTSDVIVSLGSTAVQSVNANLTLTLDSASSMENLSGGSGNDTLTGNSLANRFIGGPGNDVMTGAAGNDWYNFDADSYLGSDSIDESGGGIDTLNFSETTSYPVSVDLSYSGEQEVVFYYLLLQLTLMAGDTMENVIGGAGNDMLIGNTLNNTLTGGGGDDVLVGGAGNDTFAFDTDVNLGIDTVNESGGGVDTLDFRNTTTQNIIVDLFVTSAQVVNSNLALKLSSQYDFENVSGGALNDILIGNSRANTLTGNGGNDVLSSRAGNDILQGGAGRNILLGGFGADTLTGGADEDLLLGARFLLEEDAIALAALRNEWISASSFDDRVAHLLGTLEGGVDDGFTLTPSTVKEDSSRDTLNGGNGRDWYLRNHLSATTLWRDVINDPNLDSVFTDIDTWL